MLTQIRAVGNRALKGLKIECSIFYSPTAKIRYLLISYQTLKDRVQQEPISVKNYKLELHFLRLSNAAHVIAPRTNGRLTNGIAFA